MFAERQIQFFCSDAQFAAMEGVNEPAPLPHLVLEPAKAFSEFEVACEEDADCPQP